MTRVRMYDVSTGETIGTWSDEGADEPHGDNAGVDQLLTGQFGTLDRRERFEHFASGYSNGYWATEVIE